MKLGQTSVIYVIAKIAASFAGFLATIYFTRTLGEEVYGYYAVTLALVSWLGLVKSVGFGTALVKKMSEGERSDAYFIAASVIILCLTIFTCGIVLLFDQQIDDYIGQPVSDLVILLLISTVIIELVNSGLKGAHKVHIYAPLNTLKEIFKSLFMVALVAIGFELIGMLIGYALGTLFIGFFGFYVIRPRLVIPKWSDFTSLFNFAKYAWLGSMRSKSFNEVDILMLGFFVSSGLTGIYAVAYSLSKFLEIFGKGIQNTLLPEMSKLSVEDEYGTISELTNKSITFAGLFLIPGTIGAAVLGDRLMSIYGPGFDVGDRILVLLIFAILLYTYNRQLLNTLKAIDMPELAFRANAIFFLSNVSLNGFLIWQIGWYGAAIATTLSAAIGLVSGYYYIRGRISISIQYHEIGRQWAAALLMGGVVYGARAVGEETAITSFNEVFVVVLVGLGAGVYFLTYLAISTTFRDTVRRNLPVDGPGL